MSFKSGEQVGQYQILELLGRGGMAEVFKAYHPALDRFVAVKAIHEGLVSDKNFLARFQREARMFARLDHPNIVPIYDFSEHEGRPYIVMKFIEGRTLKERMEIGPLGMTEILQMVDAVGKALNYAHKQQILHRDIKPSNVILAKDGQTYLADFGLARLVQAGETTLSREGTFGTPHYMSPEQAMGRPDLDARTDIYSFGIMLYELVVGRVPFRSESPYTIIHDHIYTPLPLPREIKPDVPGHLEAVILKALAKDPADRYQDVESLISDFHAAVEGGQGPEKGKPTAAIGQTLYSTESSANPTPPSTLPARAVSLEELKPDPKPGRRKLVFILAGVGLLSVVAFSIAASMWLGGKGEDVSSRTQTAQSMVNTVVSGMLSSSPTATWAPEATGVPPTRQPDQNKAQQAVDAAIQAWNDGNHELAISSLREIRNMSGGDKAFFDDTLQKLIAGQYWSMAAVVLSQMPLENGMQFMRPRVELAHQVLYMAAADPAAQDVFRPGLERDYPLIAKVAVARHEFLFGNRQKAKDDLGKILSDPATSKIYPEAPLLEAEMLLDTGDTTRARKSLDKIIATPTLSPWILDLAREYLVKI